MSLWHKRKGIFGLTKKLKNDHEGNSQNGSEIACNVYCCECTGHDYTMLNSFLIYPNFVPLIIMSLYH